MVDSLDNRTADAIGTDVLALEVGTVHVEATSDWVDNAGVADNFWLDHGEALLVVVDGLDDTAESTTLERGGNNLLALDAKDVHTVADPVHGDIGEDDNETHERDDVGDTGVGCVGDSSLNRWEDGAWLLESATCLQLDLINDCSGGLLTATDTHDQDTSTATGVLSEVCSSKGEDGRVHRGLEEEDHNKDCNRSSSVSSAHNSVESDGRATVNNHNEVGLEDRGQSGSDKAAHGEGDQGVRQHLRCLCGRKRSVLSTVVDEKTS